MGFPVSPGYAAPNAFEMKESRILTWVVAVFTASVFSALVGFGGWVFNHSGMPPHGGGIFKLLVIPVASVWIVTLGGFYIRRLMKTGRFGYRRGLAFGLVLLGLWLLLDATMVLVDVLPTLLSSGPSEFGHGYQELLTTFFVVFVPGGVAVLGAAKLWKRSEDAHLDKTPSLPSASPGPLRSDCGGHGSFPGTTLT